MKTCISSVSAEDLGRLTFPAAFPASRPALGQWVSEEDMESLKDALRRGDLPVDFRWKLQRLAGGGLNHRFIEQNCRTITALLLAVEEGRFRDVSQAECERLLRLLAYVRKEDDAMPDYLPEGFSDDQQEVRAVTSELGNLLQTFKAWRLRHQVPGMWHDQRVDRA